LVKLISSISFAKIRISAITSISFITRPPAAPVSRCGGTYLSDATWTTGHSAAGSRDVPDADPLMIFAANLRRLRLERG
jgi:hypothetical protein